MGRADDRRWKTLPLADRSEFFYDGGVGDVSAVPRQKKIHSMHGGGCDVRRIGFGFGWNQQAGQQGARQSFSLHWEWQHLARL